MRKMPRMTTSSSHAAGAIRAELARRRLSHSDLAKALGWSTTAVHRRLSGTTAIDIDELTAIAGFLEVPVSNLLPAPAREQQA